MAESQLRRAYMPTAAIQQRLFGLSARVSRARSNNNRPQPHPRPATTTPITNISTLNKSARPVTSRYGFTRVHQYGSTSLKPPERFSFIWALRNFADIRDETDFTSQEFTDGKTNSVWKLKVTPNRKQYPGFVGVKLICVRHDETTNKIKVSFELALLDFDDKPVPQSVKLVDKYEFASGNAWALHQFIKMADLDIRGNRILFNDTLRIQCTLWIKNKEQNHQTISSLENVLLQSKEHLLKKYESIVTDFKQLWGDETFTDCSIITPSKTFRVHKVILAARSRVFKAMLSSPMVEQNKESVKILDFKEKIVGEMLKFLYSGEVFGLDLHAEELLKISEKYEIVHLKELCENNLISRITVANACQFLALAYIHNTPYLKTRAHQFIKIHSDVIHTTPGFMEFVKENPTIAVEMFLQ